MNGFQRFGMMAVLIASVVWGGVSEVAAQRRPDRDRDRQPPPPVEVQPPAELDGERESYQRRGGIPMRDVAPQREGNDEGTMDGMPQMQTRQGNAPSLQVAPPGNNWKLGVYAYNTETGVVVTRVVRGTAAAEVGLERGDRIVAVGGFQIGFVDNQLFPLGHELQRQANRRGEVTLLVQNVRNNRLLNIPVGLDRGRFE